MDVEKVKIHLKKERQMNYIVLDLEWNQPFSTKSMVRRPITLRGEIVQIGAVKLDADFHLLDTFKIMVSPKYYTRMHSKVTELTGITAEELQYGFPFPFAFKHFKKWCGEEFAFLTWGADDAKMLRNNMTLHRLNTDWIPNTYNVQIIFDAQITKEGRQLSLSEAIERIGGTDLEAHDALNDARNTARICDHLDMEKGLAEYDELKSHMSWCGYSSLERSRSSKTYATRGAALTDPELINFFCKACGDDVACVDFVRQNDEKYICIGKCRNGGELFVRFKFIRQADGRFGIARTVYEMNEENRDFYHKKKQKAEQSKAAFIERIAAAG